MKPKCGGVEGGQMQAVDADMNRDDSCPGTQHKVTTLRRPLPDKHISLNYTTDLNQRRTREH